MKETVLLDGMKFHRYPNIKGIWGSYYSHQNKGKGLNLYLHRYIWSKVNGDIPEGHDIHHRDGNTGNNSIENLECISRSNHSRIHVREGHITRYPITTRICNECKEEYTGTTIKYCSKKCSKKAQMKKSYIKNRIKIDESKKRWRENNKKKENGNTL
jgi:hypothetical protein